MARTVSFFLCLALTITTCLATNVVIEKINQFISNASLTSVGREFLRQAEEYEKAGEMRDTTPETNTKYDFIVVGSGTAGSIVAKRLSEIENVTVLIIEAGGNEKLIQDIPALTTEFLLTEINWNSKTEPSDSYCLGMTDRQCLWGRGKVMGGTSVLSHIVATRGHPQNYDDWSDLGNTGWSYEQVLPYFMKLENMTIAEFRENEKIHGTTGPEMITFPAYYTDAGSSFIKAGLELGYRTNYDYNSETLNGFSYLQKMSYNGSRLTSNRAYLHPARNRGNLFASKNSLVSKVLIDPESKSAYGVEFIKENETITVLAGKEVILCAGAIGSPQLLMLSGVGPEEHLTEMGITVVQDAPVGENLMDHVSFGGLVFLTNQTVSAISANLFDPSTPYFQEYVENGTGPLTTAFYSESLAFYNESSPLDTDGCPDTEIAYLGSFIAFSNQSISVYGITEGLWNEMYGSLEGVNTWSTLPVVLNPKSRGKIMLSDNNIQSQPKIIPNYFNDTEDLRILVEAIKTTIRISETQEMQKFGSQLYNKSLPDCENFTFGSDEYWECAVRILTFTMWHPSGTCRMGPEGIATSVVNPSLQVIGVNNLRVADASIMPIIPSGHIEIPTMMIAEKLSDMVKEFWGYTT